MEDIVMIIWASSIAIFAFGLFIVTPICEAYVLGKQVCKCNEEEE